ncbi:MAG: hypothetical protein M3495_00285 [Pseudomonadota bacterium]|nr:hypothetical protein [Pseudomonadota bacterium]
MSEAVGVPWLATSTACLGDLRPRVATARCGVGPFNDLKSLQGARQRLTDGRFNYMLVKIKPGKGGRLARGLGAALPTHPLYV